MVIGIVRLCSIFVILTVFTGCLQNTTPATTTYPEKQEKTASPLQDTLPNYNGPFIKGNKYYVKYANGSLKIWYLDSLQPFYGYLHKISGDFDGDGKQETLEEKMLDSAGNPTTVFFQYGPDIYDCRKLMDLQKKRWVFVSENKKFNSPEAQIGPVVSIHNLGDLDGNGTDEIGITPQNWDFSNMCHFYVYTFQNGIWNELLTFSFNESFWWGKQPALNIQLQVPEKCRKFIADSVFTSPWQRKLRNDYEQKCPAVKKAGYKKVLAIVFCRGIWNEYILNVGKIGQPNLFACPD
ncbi:MAG: hypothetical protein JNL57_08515 [Bacteroidetes bacterium]|nr:hypothetical protein [Bacteroidota bacterium]